MIKFPPTIVKIKYPGYYWDIEKQQLLSLKKKKGVLVPLVLQTPTDYDPYTGQMIKLDREIDQYYNTTEGPVCLRYLLTLKPFGD